MLAYGAYRVFKGQGHGHKKVSLSKEVIEFLYNQVLSASDVSEFFSPTSSGLFDGRTLSSSELVTHYVDLHAAVTGHSLTLIDFVKEDTTWADRSVLVLTMRDGAEAKFELMTFGELEEGKITKILQNSRQISGPQIELAGF